MSDARDFSRRSVLADLLRHRPTSRKAIALRTGLSAATVSRTVDALVADGVIHEASEIVSESRGRRAVRLDVVAERCLVVGVDLGASNTRIVVGDFAAEPIRRREAPTPTSLDAGRLADWLADIVLELVEGDERALSAVALGLPGAVAESRTVSNAPNLPQVESVEFTATLERRLGLQVGLDNDVNYALLGEQRIGAAKGTPSAAMVTIGAGLGAALAIDGRIIHGRHGLVGEFGQLPIGPFGARLEHMVTGPGIIRRAAESGVTIDAPEELFTDPSLFALRAQFDHALQIVLTAIAVSSEPEVIVLGGGIAASIASDLERYQSALEMNLRIAPRLVPAQLGEFSGAMGAVIAAVRSLYRELGVDEGDLDDLPVAAVGSDPLPAA